MRWQDLNKWYTYVSVGGLITLAMLFAGIDELAGVTVTYHSPDQVCQECQAEIHINTTYWEICYEYSNKNEFLYKKSSRGRRLWVNLNKIVLTEPVIEVEILVPTYGKKLRPIKDGDCSKRYTKANPRVSKIYIKGNPDGERIKWGLPFLDVDPDWIGWKPIYKNLSRQKEVYQSVKIEVPSVYTEKNDTWSKAYNYTTKEYSHTITEYYQGKRIGIKVGGVEYKGNYNVDGDNLVSWKYEIGDRNFIEYGACRKYEVEKGVCTERSLI